VRNGVAGAVLTEVANGVRSGLADGVANEVTVGVGNGAELTGEKYALSMKLRVPETSKTEPPSAFKRRPDKGPHCPAIEKLPALDNETTKLLAPIISVPKHRGSVASPIANRQKVQGFVFGRVKLPI
jgi:hypothetical protein